MPNVNPYYAAFEGATFVIQAEAEAVDHGPTLQAVLSGVGDLLGHGIRVLLVFGKGTRFESELVEKFAARPHPETNRLVIPETALRRMADERARIAQAVDEACQAAGIPCDVLTPGIVQVERRIGHGSTGVPTRIDTLAIRSVLDRGCLAVVGFGGRDVLGRFLHVPSVSLAADLAVELQAQKLLFLMHDDGLTLPNGVGGPRRLSFADLEGLLCLLQRRGDRGEFIIPGPVLPKVHASIRAVGGGVGQVHLVSYSRLLDEILSRTGVGTMIERQQTHHVDYARTDDLDEIERLHVEAQRYVSPVGTPYVKPLDRAELERLLPRTLLLRHREIIIGKLHVVRVPDAPGTFQIGGLVIGEDHQDSQQGQLLLSETLARLAEQGADRAVAVTASPRAANLFKRFGETPDSPDPSLSALLARALERYATAERDDVRLFEFLLRDR
ncbi:MAG: GNAT family N-acetyltransferase [Pirellulales bacterium]|nr:GNAT family N-acetyltransferase [Pirellulales bacterium]